MSKKSLKLLFLMGLITIIYFENYNWSFFSDKNQFDVIAKNIINMEKHNEQI